MRGGGERDSLGQRAFKFKRIHGGWRIRTVGQAIRVGSKSALARGAIPNDPLELPFPRRPPLLGADSGSVAFQTMKRFGSPRSGGGPSSSDQSKFSSTLALAPAGLLD